MSRTKDGRCVVVEILLLLGFLALVLWLCSIPRSPRYTIVDFTIAPNFDPETNEGSMKYSLEIKNKNRESSVFYDDILLTFYYKQDTVGKNTVPAFHQGRRRTLLVVDHVEVVNEDIWNAVYMSTANGTAEVMVALQTQIRYRTWGIKSKHHGVNLQATLPIGTDGKIFGKKKKIKLHHGK